LAEPNPTLARRQLAVIFHDIREQRKYSLDDVARQLGVSVPQASRLDTGARGYRVQDVDRLSVWYDLAKPERDRLLVLADEGRRRAWWQQVDLPSSYRTLIGMERAALSINEFCSTVIPGLLQTRAYAEAAIMDTQVGIQPTEAKQAADVRIRRQDVIDRPDPPELSMVLDETALARGAGGPSVMRPQLQRLLELSSRPEVTIQVIGFESNLYPTGAGQFMLLRMPKGLPDVYYAEGQLGATDTSADIQLRQGWRLWQTLQAIAMSPRLSAERIAQYRDRLSP
jgi:transcriptional regulator with XRE-family HTH domain